MGDRGDCIMLKLILAQLKKTHKLASDNFSEHPGYRISSSYCILNEYKWVNWVCFHLFWRIAGDMNCSTIWAEENEDKTAAKLRYCSCKGSSSICELHTSMLKKHQNVMSSENFAVHIHQSLHTDSDSWWINRAEVMFCDKRQGVSWSLILHSCKSSGSKSSLLGNWKPSDVSFLGNNVTASGAERKLLFVLCLFEMTVYSTKKSVHWV